jgi:cytochrome c5
MKLLLAALLALTANAQDQLPEGDGKKLVEKVCNECHGAETFTQKKRTKAEWDKVIQSMVDKGAEATDAEFDAIVAYLTKYFGKSE